MVENRSNLNVGNSVSPYAVVAAIVALLTLVLGYYLYRGLSSETVYGEIAIATGPQSGTYHALGLALQDVLEASGRFQSVSVQPTDGSYENMRLIQEKSGVDIAFVQADASPSTHARLLTGLYREVLHVLVRSDMPAALTSIYDLDGLRVSLGAEGSGTRELARSVIDHLGIDPSEDIIATPTEAADALLSGELDAIFILASLPSGLVQRLTEQQAVRFLSIGGPNVEGDEAAALELAIPGVERQIIPRAAYRLVPARPVSTISVSALLVVREALDEALARELTETVFSYRAGESGLEGSELAVARQIREDYNPATTTIPYHPGAIAYYNRERPPFFVEYAEALSLGVTLLLGAYSVFVAFRELLRRRMKNRVDAYLVQIGQMVNGAENKTPEALRALWKDLDGLRRQAIAELVEERLLADAAFQIMQRHIDEEMAQIEARLNRTESG